MKKSILVIAFLVAMVYGKASGTDSIPAAPEDVATVDAIVHALYDVISGPAGKKRNWDRLRTLFVPDARMMPTGRKQSGEAVRRVYSVEEYISGSGEFLEKNGFFEIEIGRRTEQFGNIVHVFSTYESRNKLADEKPFMRGINSIQLWNDGKRWWLISVLWENESEDNPIPGRYIGDKLK